MEEEGGRGGRSGGGVLSCSVGSRKGDEILCIKGASRPVCVLALLSPPRNHCNKKPSLLLPPLLCALVRPPHRPRPSTRAVLPPLTSAPVACRASAIDLRPCSLPCRCRRPSPRTTVTVEPWGITDLRPYSHTQRKRKLVGKEEAGRGMV